MSVMAKQDDYVRYTIRVPREIYADIEEHANAASRSVNAEIIQRLGDSIANRPGEGLVELKVNIPEKLYNDIVADTFIYDFSFSEYVNDILRREIDHNNQYKSAYQELSDAQDHAFKLEREVEQLKNLQESLKELYKLSQVTNQSFLNLLEVMCIHIDGLGDNVPESLQSVAKKISKAVQLAREVDDEEKEALDRFT